MSSWFSKRLSLRLTRNTVLVAMGLGLLLNLVQVTLDYFDARRSMEDEIRALMEISHSPASQIAYNIDIRLAEELLDGLLKHPAIIDARIVDPEGLVLAEASQNPFESRYRLLSDALFGPDRYFTDDLRVPQLTDIPLGRLALTIDTYHYGLRFLQRSGYTLLSGFLKSLVLSIALLFIFYFVLTRPIMNVINALGRVRAETPEKVRLPVPYKHREDEIGLMVGIINDHLDTIDSSLARLRLAESAMKNYSSQLEHEVEDRTREISEKNQALLRSNQALIRAKEDAVRKARSRASFLANMSHEIRTPLNGVLGMLNLALEGELEPAQRNRLEIAVTAGQSLLSLLNDILDISKVEAGKLGLENIPFNLRNLIEECATLHGEQARRKRIDLVVDIDPELAEVYRGDPTRTRQVINNLLNNAIKFTDTGSVRIRATQMGGNLRIDVMDTGIGMSREGLHRIFSPFSQADSDTTRLYGGTGLGLTLCRQLVERMHGQILVDSEERLGTHFTVVLPLPEDKQDQGPPREQSLPPELAGYTVALTLAAQHPHRLPIENQLRAWGLRVREQVPAGEPGMVIADADAPPPETATPPHGCRTILVDRFASARETGDTCLLLMPLRRDDLYRCLLVAAGLERPAPEPPRNSDQPAASTRKLRLLLVEDNQVNQIVASSILRKLGHDVDLAENGKRALNALTNAHYDMVLMDCQMPVMDGYEATRHIRANPDWQNLPVIAVTANVMQGDREDCLAAGMNDYITKPYNKNELRSIIERWTPAVVQAD
ncbi:ATP-binding protein [Marinobacter sp.]|uniref:hybrid sensor histidine kinase/response regulator n=1 Tax=Marinobacter sp. TaxID=50741 RepID=UPI002353E9A6|nr:ATP-binding protein [Marinobacter sp.]